MGNDAFNFGEHDDMYVSDDESIEGSNFNNIEATQNMVNENLLLTLFNLGGNMNMQNDNIYDDSSDEEAKNEDEDMFDSMAHY
jgi:hypothetical protein